jgi:hypothetical protein
MRNSLQKKVTCFGLFRHVESLVDWDDFADIVKLVRLRNPYAARQKDGPAADTPADAQHRVTGNEQNERRGNQRGK